MLEQEEIEEKIMDLIAIGASGRLIVFKPENSSIDLVVKKRGDYKSNEIFLKVYEGDLFTGKEVKEKTFGIGSHDSLYILFVNFNPIGQSLDDRIFVIPSKDLASIKDEDDLSKFLTNKNGFAKFVINAL